MSVSRYMWTKECDGGPCPGDCDRCGLHDQKIYDMCSVCVNATWDYCEYYGGYKQWHFAGCKKDLEVEWNEEEECLECEGYKEVTE